MSSVTWNQTLIGMDAESIHSASTSWTANISQSGFTACVRTSFHLTLLPPTSMKPTFNWMSFQENVQYRTDGVMYGGIHTLPNFASGSFCTNMSLQVSSIVVIQILITDQIVLNLLAF